MKYYETTDLCLASTLTLLGYELEGMDKSDTRRVVFKFEDSKKLQEDINSFWNRKIKVDALTFFDTLKNLKTRIYG